MSQEQQYPLLRSAAYQRPVTNECPVTPQQNNNNNSHQSSAPITPPETIRRSSSNESLKAESVSMTVTSNVSLTASDIRDMAQELSEARQHNEIPRTTSSPLNAQVVVEDYGFLLRLREERGNIETPPSESFMRLLVEVTRRIKERDSALDEVEVKREAARRVSNYLSTLEHEQFIFKSATSSPSTPSTSVQGYSTSLVDAETFSEEVLSIVEQVADQTLVDATEPLRHHEKVMKILQKCLREDSFDLKARIKALTGHDIAYATLLKNHEVRHAALIQKIEEDHTAFMKRVEEVHQRQNMTFQLHDTALRRHDDSLSDCGSFYSTQNATLSNHNTTYNSQNATYGQRLMVHNQLIDNQQDLNTHLLEQHRGIIASLQTMTQSQGQTTVASAQNLATVTGIINQLTAITMNLPTVMDQSVQQSVSQHVQPAIRRVLRAQQQAMVAIREEEMGQQPEIDYDLLSAAVVAKIDEIKKAQEAAVQPKQQSRLRRAIKKLFRS